MGNGKIKSLLTQVHRRLPTRHSCLMIHATSLNHNTHTHKKRRKKRVGTYQSIKESETEKRLTKRKTDTPLKIGFLSEF